MSTPNPFVRPEATTWSIEDILRFAREGQLFVPSFQRSFRWGTDDVRKLFDSIYRGYPIGDLLVWETDQTGGGTTTFGSVHFPPAAGRSNVIIDGQQRITSVVATLLDGGREDARFRLVFDLENGLFISARSNERLADTSLPLSEVADTMRFLRWLQARKLSEQHVTTANYLVRAVRDYRVPVYIVRTQDEEQIREIFLRLNTYGKRLTVREIFDALRRGRQGTDLREMAQRIETLGFGNMDEDWLLKAVAAVLGVDVTRNLAEALGKKKPEEVARGLEDAERAIHKIVDFLRHDVGVLHIDLLPYRFPLVLLTKLFHLIPEPSSSARRHLAAWVWRGARSQQHGRADAPTIRAALDHVTADEGATVDRLLDSVSLPAEPFRIRPNHDFRAAGTKLACVVLASLGPCNLGTGEALDVAKLIDESGSEAFLPILRGSGEGFRGTENRLLQYPLANSLDAAVALAPPTLLDGHCIPVEAQRAIRQHDKKNFLALRRAALEERVREFLDKRTAL